MDRNLKYVKESETLKSAYDMASNMNIDSDKNQHDLNLKNKLTNAFTDLENLKKSLKTIRGDNYEAKTNYLNNQKYDFFSDERYMNVLNQIKQSNQDKTKNIKLNSASREKPSTNNSFGVFKNQKDYKKENIYDSSIFNFLYLLQI